MKILISIPNTKSSERFPMKNSILAHHTTHWLEKELISLEDEYEIEIVEIISDNTPKKVTHYQEHKVPVEISDNHQAILEHTHKAFNPDIHIHLQLTNYKRRNGLIKDSINALIDSGADVVSSYVEWMDDYSWREIKNNKFNNTLRTNIYKQYYDGSIYTFKKPSSVFDLTTEWRFIFNRKAPVCDIDYSIQYFGY